MKISFISTVYNEEKNIKRLMNSVLKQKKKFDEIIIVDGGSTDQTFQLLKEYQERYANVKVFLKKGYKIAKARNFAINASRGEIIFISDAGCIIDDTWVTDTLKFFPKVDVVAGSYGAIVNSRFEYYQSLVNVVKVDRPSRMSSRNLVLKKNCWKKAGKYPDKDLAGEDTLFNIRLIEKGFKVTVNPNVHVKWEMRPNLTKFTKQFIRYGQGDRIQGNLKRLKLNLAMIIGFWSYLALLFVSPFIDLLTTAGLILLPMTYLFYKGIVYTIKTKNILALLYVPVLIFAKRVGYIYGASIYHGVIRYDNKK